MQEETEKEKAVILLEKILGYVQEEKRADLLCDVLDFASLQLKMHTDSDISFINFLSSGVIQ